MKKKTHNLPISSYYLSCYWIKSESMPHFQHWTRYLYWGHIHYGILFPMSFWWAHSDFWHHVIQVVKGPTLPRQQPCIHTAFWAFACWRLSNPYLWHKKWCKQQAHWPWMFHPHDSLSILAVAHWVAHLNLHKAKPGQPLCSYYHTASKTYCYLVSQEITQIIYTSAIHHQIGRASCRERVLMPV